MVDNESTMVDKVADMVDNESTMVDNASIHTMKNEIPGEIAELITRLGKRSHNPELMEKVILELCAWRDLSINELAVILQRNEKYIKTNYIKPLIDKGKIDYTIPAMLSHPDQKYRTIN